MVDTFEFMQIRHQVSVYDLLISTESCLDYIYVWFQWFRSNISWKCLVVTLFC